MAQSEYIVINEALEKKKTSQQEQEPRVLALAALCSPHSVPWKERAGG